MLVKAFRACAFLVLILLFSAFALFDGPENKDFTKAAPENLKKLKHFVVWSWQNDDDLFFIDPDTTSVAAYAGTFFVDQEKVHFRPRLNSLKVPANTMVIPAFRLVTRHADHGLKDEVIDYIVRSVQKTLNARPSPVVQIDFDATSLERASYLDFLRTLRRQLPTGTAISITSLASWNLADRWLPAGACDEAVVMLFSLGASRQNTLSELAKTALNAPSGTDIALGLSESEAKTNELISGDIVRRAKRIYLFASGGWTRTRHQKIKDEVSNHK